MGTTPSKEADGGLREKGSIAATLHEGDVAVVAGAAPVKVATDWSHRADDEDGLALPPTLEERASGVCGEVSAERSPASYEKDHALVLDLMEFFCYAVKVFSSTKL